MDINRENTLSWLVLIFLATVSGQSTVCPSPESILPCICTHRQEDVQIWCTHSDLQQVLKGVQKIGDFIKRPIDELIVENNYLPSLPGKLFQHVKILRLMLRHNGLERVSAAWLESQEMNLLEIFIVENDLKSLPSESLTKLQNLQALTIQSQSLKRIPALTNMQKLRYVNIQTESLYSVKENTFKNLPNLEKMFIKGSANLKTLEQNAFYNLPMLKKLDITNCGINNIHMRALSLLPELHELSFSNNKISDATMVGRATRDLPMLSVLNLDFNIINKLNEGAFVDQPMLETLYLSNNNINIIHHGAFHRVPKLRVVYLNYNDIVRIHPESFLQQSGSGVEELFLIGNQIMHISEFRSLLEALPRLRYLDMSDNLLQGIPRGALRGHPSLERLHLNKNSIKFIEKDAFVAMPALRELHLSNNSLSDFNEGPFWNLPALKGLDLSYNHFQRLQPKLVYNLPSLRRINLSYNQLTVIDPITFMETPLLEYVNISGNALISIHPATFRNLPNLYELDVGSNRLVEFVPGLPRGLEQLYLSRNQITTLPVSPSPDLDLPSLRTLDISSNGIQKIPYGGMKSLHNLRRLYIKRNGIRQIDTTTFNDLERLEILDISDNQIINVHPKSFSSLTRLSNINFRGNNIENFDFMIIQTNIALISIDFSRNKLRNINQNLVTRRLNVEILNISSNNLSELPASFNMLSKLNILDASNNNIKHFDGNAINSIQTLALIKMHSNKIVELRAGSFSDLKNLESVDLENNQIEIIHSQAITNLPNLISLYLGRNHIIDIPDKALSNLPKLRIIELQGNRLQYISSRAFVNIPLVQYLNLSNNQITNLDNLGIKQLISLEVLDLSFNKINKITEESFKYMEWLVELNLDNNHICFINNQPFDYMPRLKVLSLRHNKLTSVQENHFAKLRNNIAILDIDGNPLICNCAIAWLKSWLSESSSIGPKCTDGTHVKAMPFSLTDCKNVPTTGQPEKSCLSYENEALLPNLATSQVFSTIEKIKDYETHIKSNYHGNNKLSNRPLPEESEYFYDEYVDYPYNETVLETVNNEVNQTGKVSSIGNTPTLYAEMKNVTNKNNSLAVKIPVPTSGFTFFGLPLPSLDMGKLLNTGRKIDWSDKKTNQQSIKKYQVTESPRFETGGFTPMLPITSDGFMPILNPNYNGSITIAVEQDTTTPFNKMEKYDTTIISSNKIVPTKTVLNSTMHKKTKSEIHELQAYHDDDNSTHIAYNHTKNIEEQNIDPVNMRKYNLMETNLTITQITEKEGIITTDTSNDMSLPTWLDTSSISSSQITPITSKPPTKKHIESQPTALSAILLPNNENLLMNHNRTATVTKVNMPHAEHYDLRNNYAPVINREAKTRFSEIANAESSKIKHNDDHEWYYKNYNNSNLEPYIAPSITSSLSCKINFQQSYIIVITFLNIVLNI